LHCAYHPHVEEAFANSVHSPTREAGMVVVIDVVIVDVVVVHVDVVVVRVDVVVVHVDVVVVHVDVIVVHVDVVVVHIGVVLLSLLTVSVPVFVVADSGTGVIDEELSPPRIVTSSRQVGKSVILVPLVGGPLTIWMPLNAACILQLYVTLFKLSTW